MNCEEFPAKQQCVRGIIISHHMYMKLKTQCFVPIVMRGVL